MANIFDPSFEAVSEWNKWVLSRPKKVRKMGEGIEFFPLMGMWKGTP
jgi:hypothetical protein